MNLETLSALLRQSRGVDGRSTLPSEIWLWCRQFSELLPDRIWIHDDEPARRAAAVVGCPGFALRDRIYLGAVPESMRLHVLRHELVHLAQAGLAHRTGRVDARVLIEAEAEAHAAAPTAGPITRAADPQACYGFWWVAIGVGVYILLRPSVANAPAPQSRLRHSPPLPQIVFESLALFAIPGGAMALGPRLGIGFLGTTALAGAAGNVSVRTVGDVFDGAPSSPLLYLFDASTGAVIGFVVPGGFRLIGRTGTLAFDRLATYGLVRSDIAITQKLAETAAATPLDAAAAQTLLEAQGLGGRVSSWWLNRRGLLVLYRGQGTATSRILSPLARQEGVAASEALVARMRAVGLSDSEIASYTARWHMEPVPPFAAPPGMGWEPLGSVGIPTTRVPGIAANFGEQGVIYVVRVPSASAVTPVGWQGLQLENELIILNSVPSGSIVQTIPASRVAPLLVNERGLLIPGG